jgi:hypothetical protein
VHAEPVQPEELGPLRGNYWRIIDGDTKGELTALPAHVTTPEAALEALQAIQAEKDDPERQAKMEEDAKAAREAEADAEFAARATRLGYVKQSDVNGMIDARLARPNKP